MNGEYQKRGYLLEAFRLFHMRDIPKEKVHIESIVTFRYKPSGDGGRSRIQSHR